MKRKWSKNGSSRLEDICGKITNIKISKTPKGPPKYPAATLVIFATEAEMLAYAEKHFWPKKKI